MAKMTTYGLTTYGPPWRSGISSLTFVCGRYPGPPSGGPGSTGLAVDENAAATEGRLDKVQALLKGHARVGATVPRKLDNSRIDIRFQLLAVGAYECLRRHDCAGCFVDTL